MKNQTAIAMQQNVQSIKDRLEITTHSNSDRFEKIDCWGDRLDIMNYGDGDRLLEMIVDAIA